MATIIWKGRIEEAGERSSEISRHGLDIQMCGTTVHITPGHVQYLAISDLLWRASRSPDIGLCTILMDPYDLIPIAHNSLVPDCARYFDSCAQGCALPADDGHLAGDANPLARFFHAQLAIHSSEMALVFPREIMRIGLVGNDYYIAHVPPPARIIARDLATRRRLRMTNYVVRMSRTTYPTRTQVERAFRELFGDIGAVPPDIDMTIPARARCAPRAVPSDSESSDDETDADAPIVAKEYKEYDG